MTSKCKIIKYKLNANIFFQIYFCSTFSVKYISYINTWIPLCNTINHEVVHINTLSYNFTIFRNETTSR